MMAEMKEVEKFFLQFDEIVVQGGIDEELKKIENLKPLEEIMKEVIILDDDEWRKYRMLLQLYELEEEQEYRRYQESDAIFSEELTLRRRYIEKEGSELLYGEVVLSLHQDMPEPNPLFDDEFPEEPIDDGEYSYAMELREVCKESGDIIPGFRLAESYSVSYDDILPGTYELSVNDRTGHGYTARTIAGNSAMAIMDRKLRESGLEPRYEFKAFTADGKTIEGIELVGIDSYDAQADSIFGKGKKQNGYFGFLFFVDSQGSRVEPEYSQGKQIPMDEYIPKPGEKIDIAVVVEGEYDGSYSSENKFCALPIEEKRAIGYDKAAQ